MAHAIVDALFAQLIMTKFIKSVLLATIFCGLAIGPALAMRLKDLALIAGQRPNQLIGYGVMVGLDEIGRAHV